MTGPKRAPWDDPVPDPEPDPPFISLVSNPLPCGRCSAHPERVELTCPEHGLDSVGGFIVPMIGGGYRLPTANHEREGMYIDERGSKWAFTPGPPELGAGFLFGRWLHMDTFHYADLPGYEGVAIHVKWAGPLSGWRDIQFQYIREEGQLFRRPIGSETEWQEVCG